MSNKKDKIVGDHSCCQCNYFREYNIPEYEENLEARCEETFPGNHSWCGFKNILDTIRNYIFNAISQNFEKHAESLIRDWVSNNTIKNKCPAFTFDIIEDI